MTPRRRWLYVALSVVLALGVGVAFGRFFLPPRVEVRTDETAVRKLAEARAEVEVLTHRLVAAEKKEVRRVVVTRWLKSGEVERTEREHETTERETEEVTEAERLEENTKTVEEETKRSTVSISDARANWRVGLLGGSSLTLNPVEAPLGNWHVGMYAERRLVGPVWGGAWGHSNGRDWYAGVSLGMEF